MLESAQLYFPGKGNQQPKMPPTDLIVSLILSSKDKYYSRQTSDLVFRHKVSLADVITCTPVRLAALDGSIMNIPVNSMMSPGDVMKVESLGFSIDTSLPANASKQQKAWARENEGKRGDLYIKFDIQFPKTLSRDKKTEILAVLAE
jgi:DnaJ family protein B protein 4